MGLLNFLSNPRNSNNNLNKIQITTLKVLSGLEETLSFMLSEYNELIKRNPVPLHEIRYIQMNIENLCLETVKQLFLNPDIKIPKEEILNLEFNKNKEITGEVRRVIGQIHLLSTLIEQNHL